MGLLKDRTGFFAGARAQSRREAFSRNITLAERGVHMLNGFLYTKATRPILRPLTRYVERRGVQIRERRRNRRT